MAISPTELKRIRSEIDVKELEKEIDAYLSEKWIEGNSLIFVLPVKPKKFCFDVVNEVIELFDSRGWNVLQGVMPEKDYSGLTGVTRDTLIFSEKGS